MWKVVLDRVEWQTLESQVLNRVVHGLCAALARCVLFWPCDMTRASLETIGHCRSSKSKGNYGKVKLSVCTPWRYRDIEGIAPLLLDLGTGWRWRQPLYPGCFIPRGSARVPDSVCSAWKIKSVLTQQANETRSLGLSPRTSSLQLEPSTALHPHVYNQQRHPHPKSLIRIRG